MTKLVPVAVTDIATHMAHQPAYMTLVINGRKYSTARRKTPFILKALSEGAAAHGRVTMLTNRISFADERGKVFLTLAPLPTVITTVKVGLMRSKVREIGLTRRTKSRYTLMIDLVTTSGTYRLLNTALDVLPALVAWAQDYHLTVADPLNLASVPDLPELTAPQFEQLTTGTPYFTWCQTVGTV